MLTAAPSVRPLEPADREAWIAAHRDVFGAGAMSPELWEWSYLRSPPETHALVLARGDEVLGSFAARCVPARRGPVEVRLGFAVDLFVHPRASVGLGRGAQFERLANAFFERHGTRDFDALFGWPAPAALRIGQRRLGFEPIEEESAWIGPATWESEDERATAAFQVIEVGACTDALARLGRSVSTNELVCVRDERWLRWRFDQHPHHRYRRFCVRSESKEPLGFCIARGGAGLPVGLWAIADAALPCSDEALRALLGAVRRAAQEAGAHELAFAQPGHSRWGARLRELGFERRATGRTLAQRSFDRAAAEALRHDFAWSPADDDWV